MVEQIMGYLILTLQVLGSLYLSGIVFTAIIWPRNEQPITKFQWILAVAIVIILNYFIWR